MNSHSISRRKILRIAAGCSTAVATSSIASSDDVPKAAIPKVPGMLAIQWRHRPDAAQGPIEETVKWKASETAIIICDMWAEHPCKMAQMRVGRLAPKMNRVVSLARDHGVAVIHAPSGGMKHYEETTYRQRMRQASFFKPPTPIQGWCYHNPEKEGVWPIVDDVKRGTSNVSGCDDPSPKPQRDHDRHEHPAIGIIGYDGVSDSGQEIYNFLRQEGRSNVVLMGVHTNMCVLGRPFGIRQQTYLGMNVVLCRDLTDALYDPRDPPHVSHARGVELIIQHIERYWCPSILGDSLTKFVEGTNGSAISAD